MQVEAKTIFNMSETLESANFTPEQSKALVESMALSMKTFAVTPELLDDRLGKQRHEWKRDINGFKDEMIGRFDEHKDDSNQRLDDIRDLQRSLLRYFLGFTLVIVAGLMGALVTFLAP